MSATLGQPFSNEQPSLALTEFTPQYGVFPSSGSGSAIGDTLGFVYTFAGNFPPGTSYLLQGTTLSISVNPVLFDLLGTAYGGNGTSTFLLPNLADTVIIGDGSGPGLATQTLGETSGSATVSLGLSQIPPDTTPAGGGGQPFANTQPSLALAPMICVSGVFPSRDGTGGSATFIGQVAYFESGYTPAGWLPCDGRVLPINVNTALFSILGTTYGGDGKTTFALPDLRGRTIVGADDTHPLGSTWGEQNTTLTADNLPAPTGTDALVNNDQPSLALNYLVAAYGVFPPRDSGAGLDENNPIIGQVVAFAGNFVPSGYMLANGSLLPISSNTALFSILGIQYGGDGKSNFALPDLRGRAVVGTGGSVTPGTVQGSDTVALTSANLPPAPPCFAAGTRIATARGQVAVEALRVGDIVRTAQGEQRPVVWVGWREVACNRHPRPEDVWPVRVARNAFGDGRPHRDLWLSPDHAVFVDGALIPVRYLVNGASVAIERAPRVTYFHVELAEHDVLLAEGLPCESYLDTGNRGAFANGGAAVQLRPEFALRIWEAQSCAPLVTDGPVLWRAHERLVARLPALGHVLTDEPDLCILADWCNTPAPQRFGDWLCVAVPDGTRQLTLRSRCGVLGPRDSRRLGVALAALRLDGEVMRLDDARCLDGWHAPEPGWRWSDGAGVLDVRGAGVVELRCAPVALRYLAGRYLAERCLAGAAAPRTLRA